MCTYSKLYPAIYAFPEVTEMSPVNILNKVVFPAPLTPSNPKHSPLFISRLILSTASLVLPTEQQGNNSDDMLL